MKQILETNEQPEQMSREKVIVRTSIIGIIANVALAAFKAVVGLLSHSIAVVLDAVNNISDAGSSLITIIGTKLARKQPDKKHPWGYGRIEYLTAMIISVIVLYAGITSLMESVKKIIHPEQADYSAVTLIIIAVAVVVKIVLGRYVKATGQRVNSDSLINSGEDATLDSIISASTLVAAIIFLATGLSLEAWLGVIISVVIIKSGIEMLRDTISQILGERVSPELAKGIRETVCSFPQVSGAYDLILHDYGPDQYNGSIHIEIPDSMTADEIDALIRSITWKVYDEHQVILTGVGLYAVNTKNDAAQEMRETIRKTALANKHVRQFHGFYVDEETKQVRFDLVIDFEAGDRRKVFQEVSQEIQGMYPDYQILAALDTDFTE
jgi:cation diffusion facilitator family transporter